MTDKKPKLKVVEKKTAKPKVPKIKPLLKGFVYAYRLPNEDTYQIEVEKAKSGVNPETGETFKRENTYMVVNDTCDCPAGENARECKHVEMVQGRFHGNRFKRDEAEDIVEEFLEEFRKTGAKVAVIGAIAFTDKEFVTRADVLIYSKSGCSSEIIMYAETKALLVRARYLPTPELFDKTHSMARIAWANKRRFI